MHAYETACHSREGRILLLSPLYSFKCVHLFLDLQRGLHTRMYLHFNFKTQSENLNELGRRVVVLRDGTFIFHQHLSTSIVERTRSLIFFLHHQINFSIEFKLAMNF